MERSLWRLASGVSDSDCGNQKSSQGKQFNRVRLASYENWSKKNVNYESYILIQRGIIRLLLGRARDTLAPAICQSQTLLGLQQLLSLCPDPAAVFKGEDPDLRAARSPQTTGNLAASLRLITSCLIWQDLCTTSALGARAGHWSRNTVQLSRSKVNKIPAEFVALKGFRLIPSHSNYCRSFIIFPLLQICVNSWGLLQSNRHKAPPPFLKLMGGHASAYPERRDGWHTFKRAFTNPIMPVCFEQVRC